MMTSERTNEQWARDLNAGGSTQEAAISDLRTLLLRAVLFLFSRNLSEFDTLSRNEILQLAEDCAQDALIAVMKQLPVFRGDSKFTTWVYKFAINMALMCCRRQRWKGVSLDHLFSTNGDDTLEWTLLQDNLNTERPDRSALQSEVRGIIEDVINHELTDRQRQVLLMMVFHAIPMDEVVLRLGSNRNAIYKMLHDARHKLKERLQARGFEIEEILALFSSNPT